MSVHLAQHSLLQGRRPCWRIIPLWVALLQRITPDCHWCALRDWPPPTWGAPSFNCLFTRKSFPLPIIEPPYEWFWKKISYYSCVKFQWGRVVWGCELEYFTHRFVASSVRDSNHLTNHPEAPPLSPEFPLSAAIHDLSYIFNLSCWIDLSWILVGFLVGWEAGRESEGLKWAWLILKLATILGGLRTRSTLNTGAAAMSEVWPRFALKLVSCATAQSDSLDILVATLVGISPQTTRGILSHTLHQPWCLRPHLKCDHGLPVS